MRLSQLLFWHQKVEPIPLFFLLGLDTTGEYTRKMVQSCHWGGTLRYKSYTEKKNVVETIFTQKLRKMNYKKNKCKKNIEWNVTFWSRKTEIF